MDKPLYNCDKCSGYCCAYPVIQVTPDDVKRLARHVGLTEQQTRDQFTTVEQSPKVRRLKMTADPVFNAESCVFLDKKTRNCGIYKARPQICRDHPGDRCEWYDRMLIERGRRQGKQVIMLKVAPWTIDSDYPLYDADRVTELLESYADGDGGID